MASNDSLYSRISGKTATRYAVALLATGVALLLRLALNPVLGVYVPYIAFFPLDACYGRQQGNQLGTLPHQDDL